MFENRLLSIDDDDDDGDVNLLREKSSKSLYFRCANVRRHAEQMDDVGPCRNVTSMYCIDSGVYH